MSDIVIKIENLSKEYKIGLSKHRHDTLGEQLIGGVKRFLHRNNGNGHTAQNDKIWALKDISFDVERGEVVGIIGRNGAGKSTLLKILSRITEPTDGQADIYGRVASLLEVGTGFNGELTGRENIYLNGAILGMRKAEIDRKFDAIVAFSEIEKFIDTPVKRYSSGMYVRLAFAVAAHLEPEILIVDEVLAVGDFAFQKKCLGKMGEVAKEGRTVLFVSHSLHTVLNLCTTGVLLDGGRVATRGPIENVIPAYLGQLERQQETLLIERTDRTGDGRIRFTDVWIENKAGERVSSVRSGDKVTFIFEYACRDNAVFPDGVNLSVILKDSFGQPIFGLPSYQSGAKLSVQHPCGRWSCRIDALPLLPDRYSLMLLSGVGSQVFDSIEHATSFDVFEGDFFGTGRFLTGKQKYGPVLVRQEWRVLA